LNKFFKQGDRRSETHLIKNVLPDRLNTVINDLKSDKVQDSDIEIIYEPTRGRNKLYLRWRGMYQSPSDLNTSV